MEVSKFWTKTKIIILLVLLSIALIVAGVIVFNRARLKKEYIKLENRITNDAAPNYMSYEQIELKDNEYRKIDIKQIREDRLISKRADDCDGYVLVENNDGTNTYRTYLKCKNIYTTTGYGIESKMKKNTVKTQTEKDTQKPNITLIGSSTMTVNVNEEFKDPGASASDKIDGDLTDNIKVSGKVDTTKEGTYTLTYKVSDKAGNESSKKRTVIVSKNKNVKVNEKDTVVPVIVFKDENSYQKICVGEKVNVSKDGVYGYTARDDIDGDLTDKVKVSGQIGVMNTIGEYTINYSVTDKAGNEATSKRKYSVINCSTPNNQSTSSNTSNQVSTNNSNTNNSNTSTSTSSSNVNTSTNETVETNVTTYPTGINAPDTVYVTVGGRESINASVLPSNASNKTLKYNVINPNIASVDSNGVVTGKIVGETRVTITTSNGKTRGVIIIVE